MTNLIQLPVLQLTLSLSPPLRVSIPVMIFVLASMAHAHEGHRPLPTRGMEVNAETGSMVLTKAARETLDVQTVEAVSQRLMQSIHAYGSIVAPWDHHAVIASPLTGRIVELNVSPGDSVQTGQVVAAMESPELEQLVLELRAAQVDWQLSLKLVENMSQAIRTGAIPGVRLVEADTKLQQDRQRLNWRAQSGKPCSFLSPCLKSFCGYLNRIIDNCSSFDPPSAVLSTHADLSIGKVVDPKEHLFEILDLSSVWLKIQVLEKDLAKVEKGQCVKLRLTADLDEVFTGTVDVVDSFLDPETHLGTVWATLRNSIDGRAKLLPGMSGIVQLDTANDGEPLLVPIQSVIRDGAERFVLVEQEQTDVASTYQKQPLVLGKAFR